MHRFIALAMLVFSPFVAAQDWGRYRPGMAALLSTPPVPALAGALPTEGPAAALVRGAVVSPVPVVGLRKPIALDQIAPPPKQPAPVPVAGKPVLYPTPPTPWTGNLVKGK